jgi:hypothetical protein
VTKLAAEQARSQQLQVLLQQVKDKRGFTPDESGRGDEDPQFPKVCCVQCEIGLTHHHHAAGPSHLPRFLWPTHQSDTKHGGAVYSKRVGKGATVELRTGQMPESSNITLADVQSYATSLRAGDTPPKRLPPPIVLAKVDPGKMVSQVSAQYRSIGG